MYKYAAIMYVVA